MPDLTSTRAKIALALDEADAALGQPTIGEQLAAATAARDAALAARDTAITDRDTARGERDQALTSRSNALAKLLTAKAADAQEDSDRDAAIQELGG